MHNPAARALFLAAIPLAIVCEPAFAQTLPIHPDTETRAAMAWAFPLNPPPDPRTPKPDMHRPGHMGEDRGARGGAGGGRLGAFIHRRAAAPAIAGTERANRDQRDQLATERIFQLQAAPEFDRVLQQGFTDYAKLSPFAIAATCRCTCSSARAFSTA